MRSTIERRARCSNCRRPAATSIGRRDYCARCGIAEIARLRSRRRQRGEGDLTSILLFAIMTIATVIAHAVPTPSPRISPLPAPIVNYYAMTGARASGLDPALILAVILAESGGDPRAVSRADAVGMMQLEPATAADCGIADRYEPLDNVLCGSHTLSHLIRRYGLIAGLASYNYGSANVERAHRRFSNMPAETKRYVADVVLDYDMLQHRTLYVTPPTSHATPKRTGEHQ